MTVETALVREICTVVHHVRWAKVLRTMTAEQLKAVKALVIDAQSAGRVAAQSAHLDRAETRFGGCDG